jgi:hypothetical protein
MAMVGTDGAFTMWSLDQELKVSDKDADDTDDKRIQWTAKSAATSSADDDDDDDDANGNGNQLERRYNAIAFGERKSQQVVAAAFETKGQPSIELYLCARGADGKQTLPDPIGKLSLSNVESDEDWSMSLAVSQGSSNAYLAASCGTTLLIFDFDSLECLCELPRNSAITSLAFTNLSIQSAKGDRKPAPRDPRLAVGTEGGVLSIHAPETEHCDVLESTSFGAAAGSAGESSNREVMGCTLFAPVSRWAALRVLCDQVWTVTSDVSSVFNPFDVDSLAEPAAIKCIGR